MPRPPSAALTYRCPKCRAFLAKRNRRRRQGEQLVLLPGATLVQPLATVAPALLCACGHRLILVEGSSA